MTSTHVETVIVGAGQAGLATGRQLQRHGRELVILEAANRVGDQWRRQWDTLRLYTPARYDALPGLRFPADPWAFPGKDQVADYLESYAATFALPIRFGARVHSLDPTAGGYRVRTGLGDFTCDNVVVATGTFGHAPDVPSFAEQLDQEILQLHSSHYRRPGQLREGPVLVVGASHSGTDIAHEVALTHRTLLAGRDCGQVPVRLDRPGVRVALPVIVFAWRHLLTRRTPIGRRVMAHVRHHGGPMIRVKRADLAARGVERSTARVTGVRDGLPLVGEQPREVANVIWATGFRQAFEWIHLPVLGDDGWPVEKRGVVEKAPGLFFCGLSFQYSFSSMVLPGVARDAEFVVQQILRRSPAAHSAAPAPAA